MTKLKLKNSSRRPFQQLKKFKTFNYSCSATKTLHGRRLQIKVLYSDAYSSAYNTFSKLFCAAGNPSKAFYAEELGRARAFLDLKAIKYQVERKISADPRSWIGIKNIKNLESDCTFYMILN